MTKLLVVVAALAWTLPLTARAEGTSSLTLAGAEDSALKASRRLEASSADATAAREQASAQFATLFPRLSLDGSYRYASVIPELRVGGLVQRFGDNNNYSIGPTLTYTLWDGLASLSTYKSLQRIAHARSAEAALAERQVRLQTRTAYTQAQLAREELALVEESLALSRKQSRDIDGRFKTGSSSRLDALSAQREVTQYELRQSQARADVEVAFAELAAWVPETGRSSPGSLKLDPIEDLATRLESDPVTPPGAAHPQMLAQALQAEAFDYGADAQRSGYWPAISLLGRTSLDYPNGPTLVQIHQNAFQVNLSWSLFEFGRTKALVAQKSAETEAARDRLEQSRTDLKRDWNKARARAASLRDQGRTAGTFVAQSEQLARLNYQAYQAGRLNLLDVQASNVRLLEARVQKTRIAAQLLLQLYALEYLSNGKDENESR